MCSEPSQQYENLFGIIVVKFVGHPPSRYGIWFFRGYAPLTVSLQFLCFWMWGLSLSLFFFGGLQRPPVDGCSIAAILVFSQEEMCICPTLPSWTGSPLYYYYFFNWRKLSLQCCVDFCFTTTWIRYIYIYTHAFPLEPPSPLLSHPFRLSQSTKLGSLCDTAASY